MKPIIGILLAAGSSRRFGADKLNQLLPDGDVVAVSSCRNLLAATDAVLAVVRPGNEQLVSHLRAEGAEVQLCVNAEQGMGTSLAIGICNALNAAGWVVALADMPWILPATIRSVADAIRSGALISAPSWQGQRGHPVGFAYSLSQELIALQGDVGAKVIIQAHKEQLSLINCQDPGILQDIDRPEDLLNLTNIASPK